MTYNSINGQPACANDFTLVDELRGKWGFNGYVVSDCGAVIDIFKGHHYKPTQAEASATSLKHGMDNECVDGGFLVKSNFDYKPYLDAVAQGYLKESDIDVSLVRLYTARMKLGMFDPPELDPYSRISGSELDSPEHRSLARKIAKESMVLLKNDGVLPIKNLGTNIAVIGPLAEQGRVLLGNYNGQPSHTVTILEGIKKEFVGANVSFEPGTMFLSREAKPVPASALSVDGKPGVKVDFAQMDMSDINHPGRTAAFASRVDQVVDLSAVPLPEGAKGVRQLSVQWTADLTAPETGDYNLGMISSGSFRIRLDGKAVTSAWDSNGAESRVGRVHLEAGKPAKLEVTYSPNESGETVAKLVWVKLDLKPQTEAIEAGQECGGCCGRRGWHYKRA